MNPRLFGIAGPWKGVTFPLVQGEITIGREQSNQLHVADPALSRRQCLLSRQGEEFSIRDLGSRNGTLVNGVPVQQQALQHGDQICVGESILVLLLDEGRPQESPIEFLDNSDLKGDTVILRHEDAVYLRPDLIGATLPDTARLARDLNALLKIATGIGGIRDRDALQWQMLGFIFDVVPAERGAVFLFDHPQDLSSAVAWDRVQGPGHAVRVSRTILNRVLEDGVGVLVANVPTDESLRSAASLSQARVHSLVCVPLVVSDVILGAIYLDTRDPAAQFDENHLQVMTAVAGIASLALGNVRHCEQLRQENETLRAQIEVEHNMVGVSSRMQDVFEFIRRVAPTDSTVLINGESGTGKELVARAIHRNSPRAQRSFVPINCAAITETLLESELFGHEKGAFTGAVAQKKGKIEVADSGTLFLDEVSELAPGLQAKLLRVLQEREFERVGGTRSIKLDVRVLAASNRNLSEAVASGAFRKDLYYRLNVVTLTLPPLRERREDIPMLAEHFLAKASRKCRTQFKALSPEARACLLAYHWPGNVRELENAIERAIVLGVSETVQPDDLPEDMLDCAPSASAHSDYHDAIRETKKQLVLQALQQASGSYIEAAKALGMHPNSLLRLIRNLELKAAVKAGSTAQFSAGAPPLASD